MRGYVRFIVAVMCLLAGNEQILAAGFQQNTRAADIQPTPVTGESWLNHLHRSFGDTSMGKTGRLGPPAPDSADDLARPQAEFIALPPQQFITLRGSDLYRINCQACHGDAGLGLPPEINSVINPVRATSVPLVIARMKSNGMEITPAAAAELAKQSKLALLQRLHSGGENMPPFPHLSEEEIRVLLTYLNQLAGVTPSGEQQSVVKESPLRVGEHIVKSTCHICHGATGANPSPQQLEDGAIPPLETLPDRVSEAVFIRKITLGTPIVMGTPPTPHRGRMPVFDYLTREEAADVYVYLTHYRPTQEASDAAVALLRQDPPRSDPPRASAGSVSPTVTNGADGDVARTGEDTLKATISLTAIGLFVMALLGGGLGFTLREFRRLSLEADAARMARAVSNHSHRDVADLVAR